MKLILQIFELRFQLLEATVKFLFEALELLVSSIPKKKEGYHASFGSASTLLSAGYKGFCLTGNKNLSIKNSYQNALVVGGTGVGKSSIVLLPSLYTMEGSFIVHDPSGELFTKSAGPLISRVYEVKVLNFSNSGKSAGYNPIIRAKTSSEINKLASMLVNNALGNGSKDPFWNTQAVSLLSMFITILKKQDSKYQNLFNVRHLLNNLGGNPERIDKLFSDYADDALFSEYKSFLSYDDKVKTGVTATCKAALQIFTDENVAKITSFDTLNFEDFRNKKVALFIQNSVADQKYFSVLTSLFFEQFFSYTMSRFSTENEQDIFFLIDEASSLNLPTLQLAVANVRKHRAGIMLVVQDFNQIVHQYGKNQADAIKSNCFAKLYFTAQSLETTKELEQILGKFEYLDKDKHKQIRSLLTSDEIRKMPIDRALLLCGHFDPIYVKLCPYYDNRSMKNFGIIPVPTSKSEIPFTEIPILPLTAFED